LPRLSELRSVAAVVPLSLLEPALIYLDHNATLPIHPDVMAAMAHAAAHAWGNPSSLHAAGRAARQVLDDAREAVATLTGMSARDVILTSGGTEANNLGILRCFPEPRGVLITSELEHPSVLAVAEELARRGVIVRFLPPHGGRFDPADLDAIWNETTGALSEARASGQPCLVALHAVHPETGVIQPVPELLEATKRGRAELHLDAVQAAGRLPAETFRGADSLALAAHKLQGPKGIGALVTQPTVVVRPLTFGGAQERGLRPGTQDPVAAAGFAVAARLGLATPERWEALRPLRDRLEATLLAAIDGAGRPVGAIATIAADIPRAPHVSHLAFPGWAGDELVAALDLEGVCISAGSACSAGTSEPSRAVRALRGREHAAASVRISLGCETTEAEVDRALAAFARVLGRSGLAR
jgi:cysteine desulfurase